jgi:hypothetical protein
MATSTSNAWEACADGHKVSGGFTLGWIYLPTAYIRVLWALYTVEEVQESIDLSIEP